MNINMNDPAVILLLQKGLQKVEEEKANGVNPPHKGGFIKKGEDIELRLSLSTEHFDKMLLWDSRQGRKSANEEEEVYPLYAYYDYAYTPIENGVYKKREYKAMVRVIAGMITRKEAKEAGYFIASELKKKYPSIKKVSSFLTLIRSEKDQFAGIAEMLAKAEAEDSDTEEEEESE